MTYCSLSSCVCARLPTWLRTDDHDPDPKSRKNSKSFGEVMLGGLVDDREADRSEAGDTEPFTPDVNVGAVAVGLGLELPDRDVPLWSAG